MKLAILAMLFLAQVAVAQTLTWTGGGDGVSFGDGANWDPAASPGETHDCVIPTGTSTSPPIEVNAAASVRSISTGRNLRITACLPITEPALTISNGITLSDGAIVRILSSSSCGPFLMFRGGSQSLQGNGELRIQTATGVRGVYLANNCQLTIGEGVTVRFQSGGASSSGRITGSPETSLINRGTIACRENGKSLWISGALTFANEGLVEAVTGTVRITSAIANYSPSTCTLSGGTWRARAGGIILMSSEEVSPICHIGTGTVVDLEGHNSTISTGEGDLLAALSSNNGTVRFARPVSVSPTMGALTNAGLLELHPGALLSLNGDFVQTPEGTFSTSADGPAPSQLGRLIATGESSLSGTLRAVPSGKYVPSPSTQLPVILASALSGDFTAVNGNNLFTPVPVYTATEVLISFVESCSADFDTSGSLGVPDIFAFLSAWFALDPAADFNGDSAISVPDIFSFLSAWFTGCP